MLGAGLTDALRRLFAPPPDDRFDRPFWQGVVTVRERRGDGLRSRLYDTSLEPERWLVLGHRQKRSTRPRDVWLPDEKKWVKPALWDELDWLWDRVVP